MAVMADFARMPTQRKVGAFILIGALIGGLYYQFVFKGLNRDIDEAEQSHLAKLALNKKDETDIPKFAALNAHMSVLQRQIDENQKALPTESELPAFFETLNRKVTEAGVEVNKWRQVAEEPVERFVKVPVEVEMTGTFMQIKKFFASLVPKKKRAGQVAPDPQNGDAPVEERERIVSIENLSLTNPTVKNHELILTAKFTAATYRQEDKKEDPAAKTGTTPPPPPPPATPPAGAGSGSALAPAATPQGAKQRVNNAMDKDDTRTRTAPGAPTDGSGSTAHGKGGL